MYLYVLVKKFLFILRGKIHIRTICTYIIKNKMGSHVQYVLIKRKRKFSSYIRKLRMEQLQSHV